MYKVGHNQRFLHIFVHIIIRIYMYLLFFTSDTYIDICIDFIDTIFTGQCILLVSVCFGGEEYRIAADHLTAYTWVPDTNSSGTTETTRGI